MKISGRVAFVTGGASGIGQGICETLLQFDAKVSPSCILFLNASRFGDLWGHIGWLIVI